MKRKIINFRLEDEDAQKIVAEWIPFPNAQSIAQDVDTTVCWFEISGIYIGLGGGT